MSKRVKRIFCTVLICTVLVSISACGDSSSDIIKTKWNFEEVTENDSSEYFVMAEGKYKLYSNRYFNCFFEKDYYSLQEILSIADNNKNIPDEYRAFINDFIEKTYNYYPNLDWRIFAYNLNSVTFKKVEVGDYEFESGAVAARYLLGGENKIEIREDLDVKNDEFAIRVFRHELGHMFNSLTYDNGKRTLLFDFKSAHDGKRGISVLEAADVIFTVDPFISEYTADNLGYSILANVMREVIDCSDYPMEAFISNNIEYFEENLDKSMPNGKTAREFVDNFDYMLSEASSETITKDMPEITYIYECVAEMYAEKYITKDMTEKEIMDMEKALEDRLLKGAPHPEYVYTDVIERIFKKYTLK